MSKKCKICNSNTYEENTNNRLFYICEECNFVFTEDFDKSLIVRGAGMEGSWVGPGGGGFREYYLAHMLFKDLSCKSFLLFGTGNTSTFEKLRTEGFNVTGCDISEDVVKYKQAQFGKDSFYTPSNLPKDKKYDAIIAVEVIEHFHEPHESFSLLKSVLSNKGIICGTTDFFIGRTVKESDTNHYMRGGHVAYWNKKSLSRVFENTNFRVIAFEMIRPGSVLPDEKYNKLFPNRRVFFIYEKSFDKFFNKKFAKTPILPIDKP